MNKTKSAVAGAVAGVAVILGAQTAWEAYPPAAEAQQAREAQPEAKTSSPTAKAPSAWKAYPPAAKDSLPTSYPPGACSATDGDTIRCGDERIRLVEIDAPELPGHCRAGRECAPGDPHASTRALQEFIKGRRLLIIRYDRDRYGRTVGDVLPVVGGASCAQVRAGQAIVQLKWGDYGVVRKECP